MINYLSYYETEIVQDLLNIAFSHSAEAFSRFIKKPVMLSSVQLKSDENIYAINESENQNFYILVSELRGDLSGKCFLNFTHKDANTFCNLCLPFEYREIEEMREAILLELDNILTAAVVTMISDILKINTHAHVPELINASFAEFNEIMEEGYKNNQLNLHFKTCFEIENVDLSPEFIWLMDLKIINAIIKFTETESGYKKIQDYKEKHKI